MSHRFATCGGECGHRWSTPDTRGWARTEGLSPGERGQWILATLAETSGTIPGVSALTEGADDPQGIRETQEGLWEVQSSLHKQLEQLAEEQQALAKLLQKEFLRNCREHDGKSSAKARTPGAECWTCYACGWQGHLRWDCPYWVGGKRASPLYTRLCELHGPRGLQRSQGFIDQNTVYGGSWGLSHQWL